MHWEKCFRPVLLILSALLICTLTRASILEHLTSEISGRCGPCLCNDTYVNCSRRQLTEIPTCHFPSTAEIINLENNNITDLPDKAFSSFTALKSLSLSGNQMTRLGKDVFAGVAKLEYLNLSWNYLLPGDEAYPEGVFRSLSSSLKDLRLEGNCRPETRENVKYRELRATDVSLDAFQASRETAVALSCRYPEKALSDLENLHSLFIDGLLDTQFGPGFANMTQLQNLYLTGQCKLNTLTNETFVNLPKDLSLLDVSDCGITAIEANALRPLRNLSTLDLSRNQGLGFDGLATAMYGLQGSNLTVLRIDSIVYRYSMSVRITQWHTRYFKNTSIERIIARYNELEYFCEDALSDMPKSLNSVDLTGNRLSFGRYFKDLHKLTSLTELVIDGRFAASPIPTNFPPLSSHSENHDCGQDSVDDFSDDHGTDLHAGRFNPLAPKSRNGHAINIAEAAPENERGTPSASFTTLDGEYNGAQWAEDLAPRITAAGYHKSFPGNLFKLPPNLKVLRSKYNQLYYRLGQIDFHPNNSLDALDLTGNLLAVWIGPITGLNLSNLSLSNNFAHTVSYSFFQNLTSLKHFNGSENHLRWQVQNDENGTLFEPLVNLKVLDLSRNSIKVIPQNYFKGLVNLETLFLGMNLIQEFTVNLDHMHSLKRLVLSDNDIQYLPQTVMNQLDNIAALSKQPLTVTIFYNPIACTCHHLDFLTWVTQSAKVWIPTGMKYLCQTADGRTEGPMPNLLEVTEKLKRSCADHTMIFVGAICCTVCLLVTILSALVYRFRWKLRYLYYATRLKYSRLQASNEDHFEFDAFVSYASEDREFVHGELLERLEQRERLKLNIHNRDWMPGRLIPSNIVAAVQSSRHTLVVLTKKLVDSDWCRYEMQMASMEASHSGRDVLLFLLFDDVQSQDLPREVLYNLRNSTYIQYPHQEQHDNRLVDQFWQRLALAIKEH